MIRSEKDIHMRLKKKNRCNICCLLADSFFFFLFPSKIVHGNSGPTDLRGAVKKKTHCQMNTIFFFSSHSLNNKFQVEIYFLQSINYKD